MVFIKRINLLLALSLSVMSIPSFAAHHSDEAIAKRIAPVGDVYIDGEIVTATPSGAPTETAGPRSGESVYNTFCVACHGTGAAGAPIKGDAATWLPRMEQGKATLVKHAIEGINGMPAMGTCADCSDDEIIATVEFMTQGL